MRTLPSEGCESVGFDIKPSPFTQVVGSVCDRELVRSVLLGVDVVLHTATLHKPHVVTHAKQQFIDTNITGTLTLLEESASAGVKALVYTSTTSVFGRALAPDKGKPAVWITEDVAPVPKNIYGASKLAAEHVCELVHCDHRLPCIILRTARFFPDLDDNRKTRTEYGDLNVKVNEFLYRRVELEDVVRAHIAAMYRARSIGFGRYIISATSPFVTGDLPQLNVDASTVVGRHVPRYEQIYQERGWKMFPEIDRVYVNDLARKELGWAPTYDFGRMLERLVAGQHCFSNLAQLVGTKGYHEEVFPEGIYPVG